MKEPGKSPKAGRFVVSLCLLAALFVIDSAPTWGQGVYARIYSYYSRDRLDHFTTTDPVWAGTLNDTRSPDYRLFRIEGRMFSRDRPQPAGTVPVYSWYSPGRKDNILTSNPGWRGVPGDTREPDYRFVRLEGYAFDPGRPQPAGAVPLYSWYSPDREDNLATTNRRWAGVIGVADRPQAYRYVRREGYVLPVHPRPDLARMIVPVFFHFQGAFTDSTTGLPAFGDPTEPLTMLDVDEHLAKANAALDAARGYDSRRVTFARAGVKYIPTPTEDPELTVPLYQWWSSDREDYFATTNSVWRIRGHRWERLAPDYEPRGVVGLLFRPDRPQPDGTVAVAGWYSSDLEDNRTTSSPDWVTDRADPDYRFSRLEGYLYDPARPRPPNTVELHSWYSESREDRLILSDHTWAGSPGETRRKDGDDYVWVRKEGYAPVPSGCGLLGPRIAENFLTGAINALITSGTCAGVAITPSMIRAESWDLPHELGHAMGLFHMYLGNQDLATVELLYRELNPDDPASCYRRGDRVCDTPPDYGFASVEGVENPGCDGNTVVPAPCRQPGPPCDPQEPMLDGGGLCVPRDGGGERRYEAVALGLQLGTPNNIMAYHNHDEFSYEQFLRVLDYGLWRAGKAEAVPSDEKLVFSDFFLDGIGPPIWGATPDATERLAYVQRSRVDMRATGSSRSWSAQVTPSVGRRLLDFRIEIEGTGQPTNQTTLIVGFPDGRRRFSNDDLLIEDGRVVFDEIHGGDLSSLRGRRPSGVWNVELQNVGTFVPSSARLSVLAE